MNFFIKQYDIDFYNNNFTWNNFDLEENFISFYFPLLEFHNSYGNYNESNSLLVFEAQDNKYHNISLLLKMNSGTVQIDLLVENCQDYGAIESTNNTFDEYSFNFISYNLILKAPSDTNRSDPNNFFTYTSEVNGSYLIQDFGPTSNVLGELEHAPCQWIDGFNYFPTISIITTSAILLVFLRKSKKK